MGVELFWEDERGTELGSVLDPFGFIPLITELAGRGGVACLSFIDPYGNTVFNQSQVPVLTRELEGARAEVTDAAVVRILQRSVDRARKDFLGPSIVQAYEARARSFSASDVRAHLERVIELVHRAEGHTHTYLKFVGD